MQRSVALDPGETYELAEGQREAVVAALPRLEVATCTLPSETAKSVVASV